MIVDHSSMKLGKNERRYDQRTMRLGRYLPAVLPVPETLIDYSNGVTDWGLMLNGPNDYPDPAVKDGLGDCTMAGCAGLIQLATMNDVTRVPQGMVTPTDATVLSYYEKWCGFDPKNPATDEGGVELDVLNLWRQQGFDGHKLLGYAAIDIHNYRHVQYALNEFNVYLGVELPVSAQTQDTWDVVSNDGGVWGGHCVTGVGYNDGDPTSKLIRFRSWGKIMEMTIDFWNKYVSEAYALMLEDFEGAHSRGPDGFDLVAWNADLGSITSA